MLIQPFGIQPFGEFSKKKFIFFIFGGPDPPVIGKFCKRCSNFDFNQSAAMPCHPPSELSNELVNISLERTLPQQKPMNSTLSYSIGPYHEEGGGVYLQGVKGRGLRDTNSQ